MLAHTMTVICFKAGRGRVSQKTWIVAANRVLKVALRRASELSDIYQLMSNRARIVGFL